MYSYIRNPNSYFGYVIQTPRALHYLLEGAKIVSVETKDDISAVDYDDKLIVIEQIKDKDTTFSNCSTDFWCTFANWINRYKENTDKFTNRTQFIIFSNRKQQLKKDSFIEICNNAENDANSKKSIETIKSNFSSKNPKIQKCFEVFKDEQNEDIVVNIIRNFSYKVPNAGIFEDLKNKVQELHSENRDIEELRFKMLGWINEKIYNKETDKIRKFDLLQTDFRNYLDNNKNLKLALIDDVSEFDIEDKLIDANIIGKGIYESKLNRIRKQINEKTEKINILTKNKDILDEKIGTQSLIEDLYVKIIGGAKKIINEISEKNNLDQQIEELNDEIAKYNFDIDELRQKQLTSIVNKSNSYVPNFAEFDEIASFSKEDLTVKVKNKYSSESYFLWETGSGSNWVAYHIATMLGLHKHFIYKKTPVFNFIIFDQPSQVYFPKVNYQHKKDFDFNDEKKSNNIDKGFSDLECVQEMFKIMSKAINDNKLKKIVKKVAEDETEYETEELFDSKLQIIVLDHAGPDVWKNQEGINDINPLEEWTLDNRLVPQSWIKE